MAKTAPKNTPTPPSTDSPAVQVRGRYHRSVHVQRDAEASLEHYLITPTVRELTRRIIDGLAQGGTKVWSVTGPFGTGKSAFALFLSQLLAHDIDHPHASELETYRDEHNTGKLFAVRILGQRRDLHAGLLEQLTHAIQDELPKLSRDISRYDTTDDAVLTAFQQTHDALQTRGWAGMVLIVDEFGKFLEHSARHRSDILIMQTLAEYASRSDAPFVLVTILHSAFSSYLDSTTRASQRSEWQKVQGRFQDVAFQEPPEQLLRLVANALDTNFAPKVRNAYDQHAKTCLAHPALAEASHRFDLAEILPACAPFEPITALLLAPLFRSKLAQNERSLFAFLTSYEPYSLHSWLEHHQPYYRLPDLYDYVSSALGSGLFQGEASRTWVEIADALAQLGQDAPPLADDVIKAVGLLWMYGASVGVRADADTLQLALAAGDTERIPFIDAALAYLERRSFLVYRRYTRAFALWQGSDIDLADRFQAALARREQGNVAARLAKLVEVRPVVARAHYVKTGTLRYFTVHLIDASPETLDTLEAHLLEPFDTADNTASNAGDNTDGRITFVLTKDEDERQQVMAHVQQFCNQPPKSDSADKADSEDTPPAEHFKRQLIAFPQTIHGLVAQLEHLEAWQQVKATTPELASDRVARRELAANVHAAQRQLEHTAGSILGVRGQPFTPEASDWLHAGKRVEFASALAFQRYLSRTCDALFYGAPPLKNELLNRDKHSSSAKAALNKLVKAMINAPDQHRFGIKGTPPEVSMYEAFFAASSSHVARATPQDDTPTNGQTDAPTDGQTGAYQLQAPANQAWQPIWQEIQAFLHESEHQRLPVRDLYARLQQPPFGMRAGTLPLFLYLALQEQPDRVALYRDGLYQPVLSEELSELLTHVPERFAVQRFAFDDTAQATLHALKDALSHLGLDVSEGVDASALLMQLSRPLIISVHRLNDYSKKTRHLSKPALSLRDALLKATDPHALLLQDVPALLGVPEPSNPEDFATLSRSLQDALRELLTAYPKLLDSLEQQLATVFDLPTHDPHTRVQSLQAKTAPLRDYAHTPPLSLFVREVSRLDPQQRDWREVLGRVLMNGLPPTNWRDRHAAEFQINLSQLHFDFVRLSELVQSKTAHPDAEQIIRVDVLDREHRTLRTSIPLSQADSKKVQGLAKKIKDVIVKKASASNSQLALAALTKVLTEQLEQVHPSVTSESVTSEEDSHDDS